MTDRSAWLAARRSGIGGSDAPAVLGVSRYRTALDVFDDKCGIAQPQPDNEKMLWGRMLEPVILARYAEVTGRELMRPATEHGIARSSRAPWLICTPDAYTRDGRNVQAKTAGSDDGWGEPGTDQMPDDYLVQCQHEMLVLGLVVTDVPVLFRGSDFRIYTVRADAEFQEGMFEVESAFWRGVEAREPPPPQSTSEAALLASRLRSVPPGRQATDAELLLLAERARLLSQAAEIEAEVDRVTDLLKVAIGDAEALIGADGKPAVTWKSSRDSTTTDWAALAGELLAALPDVERERLLSLYQSTNPGSRRFLSKI
jgi:putative phage-type endonuclease